MEWFLSAADAARLLGVTTATVRLMARRGDLPVAAKTVGGIHLFKRPDVTALAARRNSPQSSARAAGRPSGGP